MKDRKMWLQLLAAVALAIWAALTDDATRDAITPAEWIVVATMAVGAFGVQIVPNLDEGIGKYAKGVVSFLTAALPALALVIAGGLTTAEVLEVLLVGAAAVGLVVGFGNPKYVFATKRSVQATPAPPL
jgi:peptidoglycan/LPS O-acetylase OafA/YrhL